MELKDKLRSLRSREAQSLQQVADAIGVSKAHVWELETGRSKNPSLDILQRLAKHYRVAVAYLVEEAPLEDARTQGFLRSIEGKVSQMSDSDLDYLKSLADRLVGRDDGADT
jgi:transcriptional regulator with XRE-family HTH domain